MTNRDINNQHFRERVYKFIWDYPKRALEIRELMLFSINRLRRDKNLTEPGDFLEALDKEDSAGGFPGIHMNCKRSPFGFEYTKKDEEIFYQMFWKELPIRKERMQVHFLVNRDGVVAISDDAGLNKLKGQQSKLSGAIMDKTVLKEDWEGGKITTSNVFEYQCPQEI